MFYIGAHLSSAKGFQKMGETAVAIGANTIQFFTRNPRGGAARALNLQDIQGLREILAEHSFGSLLAHAPYTMNPCSADLRVRAFARQAMTEDLERVAYFPGSFYNFHPGSHVGQGVEKGICLIAAMLNEILTEKQESIVLLETMAGKGSEVGSKFEELAEIIKRVHLPEKIGVCLDTCHVYDAGYDIVHDLDGVIELFDRQVGLQKLKAIHLNDSKNPFASHKDRHERIGWGSIGLAAFEKLIIHPSLSHLPFFLETPNELDGYAAEILLLQALRNGGGEPCGSVGKPDPLVRSFLTILNEPDPQQEFCRRGAANAARWLELLPEQEQTVVYGYIEEQFLKRRLENKTGAEGQDEENDAYLVLLMQVLQDLKSGEACKVLDAVLSREKEYSPYVLLQANETKQYLLKRMKAPKTK